MSSDPSADSTYRGVGSDAGHLAALASLDRVGPARMRWLAGLAEPAHVWELVRSGRLAREANRAGSGVGGTEASGTPRLEEGLLERWRRSAEAHPELPSLMQQRLCELDVDVLATADLPSFLRTEPEPPGALFCAGNLASQPRSTVAIIGTRRASSYGQRIARQLGRDLSEQGVTVVSGLALGIDAAAHAGALEGGSPAVAVIGAGHDRPCPIRNRALAQEIEKTGLLVSEVPPGAGSAPWRFPVRNRLIAAFSEVIVVVESAPRGGSMSTVGEALLRDRAVMAVPGPLGRAGSEGCHELLRDGAEICTSADDVMSMLRTGARPAADFAATAGARSRRGAGLSARTGGGDSAGGPPPTPDPGAGGEASDGLAGQILAELAESALTLDTVTLRCGAPLAEVTSAVAELELGGSIAVRGGWLERLN